MSDIASKLFAMMPTREEIDQQVTKAQAKRLAIQADAAASNGFNVENLGHWLDLCVAANIPAIPGELIAEIPVDDVTRFDHNPIPETVRPFFATVAGAMRTRGVGWMVRWACCSCEEIKYRLGSGAPEWRPEFARLDIDDPRAFEIIMYYPDTMIGAYARPWAPLRIYEGYPIEFRVYVENDAVIGVSNYYPQRALPLTATTLEEVGVVIEYTEAMIRAQTRPLNAPQLRHYAPHLDLARNHWTADFAWTETNGIQFLEGGPPHTPRWGAHMCCFQPGEIEGIALRNRRGES